MSTKIARINGAYSQMRISGLTVDPTAEDIVIALDRLENMMSELEKSRNICLEYNFEEELLVDPNSPTNVDRSYWHMMDTNLAVRLIPDFNKAVPPTLFAQASQSVSSASSQVAAQNMRQVAPPDRMPIGSGSTLRYNKYQRFNRETEVPPNDCSTNRMIMDDIDDFEESFESYLDGVETISSFTITVDSGITLVSSANNDPIISYRIKAVENQTSGIWQQARIVITTSTGRVETRFVNFDIRPKQTVGNN